MTFYKYHGAGNDFLIADGRSSRIDLTSDGIAALCDRHTGFGADGVMILSESEGHDFRMDYYNSDGSGGMMCGNGGRCIVAFASGVLISRPLTVRIPLNSFRGRPDRSRMRPVS